MKKLILILLILLVSNISESQTVTPKLEYVTNYGNGVYLALWGYQNSGSNNVTIPISSSANKFAPTPRDRGQPTVFLPGRQYNVFNTPLTYGSSLNWKINSESFTAYSRNFLVYVTDSLTTMPPAGNTVKYYIKAKNSENTTWNFVTIKDTLPAGTSFVSATGGGTCAGNVVTWIPGNISEGNSVNVTVTVSVTSSLPDYVNKVWAYSSSTYRSVAYDENTGQQGSTITENFIMTFEDLKGYGWNDWDMNDFVSGVKATIYLNNSSAVTQLKFEYEALARGSTYIHALKHFIPVTGSSTGTLTVRDSNNIIIPSLSFTNRNYSGAINETIFPSTMEALPPMSVTNQTANTHPSQQGVIKGYTAVFIITFAPTDATNLINHYSDIYISVRPATPYTQLIHVADLAGSFGNTQTVSNQGAISSQLYGYYLDLGNKVPYNWHWPREGVNYPLWSSYTKYTNFILSSKVVNSDWYNYPDTAKTWNKRNVPPTDFISLAQSQKSTASGIFRRGSYNPDYLYDVKIAKFFASPKTADINNDGKLEVLIGALDNKFYAIDYNGNNLPGFPVTTSSFIKSTAAVYKNTGGSSLIAFGNDDGDLYLLNQNGQAQSGFPKNIGYSIKASPVFSNL
ncbi:MAG: LruC domain-containing protein, partial [Ignavibacteriae bacterium]|nr:LruC domain-containing protein [Ignavibacteriota bacterium]